jgi:phosphoribosyl 1,2-cyclic phosphodiesterase
LKVVFWGVRGSTPVCGADFVRYGGSTSCITISPDGDAGDDDGGDTGGGEALPRLVLDAGTGLLNLARRFGAEPFRGTILLTHMHWDHMQGLPFFWAADREAAEVDLRLPVGGDDEDAEHILGRVMQPPFFPIGPHELRGRWTFSETLAGPAPIQGLTVSAHEIPHKGGRTVGYRVSDGASSVAYVPDHRPTAFGPGEDGFGEYHRAALDLATGVDVLVHGGPYRADELQIADNFGHTTIPYAIGLAVRAGAKRLVITHHSPVRTDEQLDELSRRAADAAVPVQFAFEGLGVST